MSQCCILPFHSILNSHGPVISDVLGSMCWMSSHVFPMHLFNVFRQPVPPHNFTASAGQGWVMLKDKIQKGGPLVLWAGWEGNYMANVVGNYPWFATMNVLQKQVAWRFLI